MLLPRIILFRSPHPDDVYEAVFRDAGWQVASVPVLAFRYKNEAVLHEKLENAGGLIVTSPRAGDLCGKLLKADAALRKKWLQRPIVCIGKRSAEALEGVGLCPFVSAQASGEAVAEAAMNRPAPSWLFVCGNLRRDALPDRLQVGGVPFEELEVYDTLLRDDLDLAQIQVPDWVVFFSPSGVASVQSQWPAAWKGVQKAAIGSTTADAITKAGWRVDAIAANPDPQSLLAAV